jgi:site-specific DNA recombinase
MTKTTARIAAAAADKPTDTALAPARPRKATSRRPAVAQPVAAEVSAETAPKAARKNAPKVAATTRKSARVAVGSVGAKSSSAAKSSSDATQARPRKAASRGSGAIAPDAVTSAAPAKARKKQTSIAEMDLALMRAGKFCDAKLPEQDVAAIAAAGEPVVSDAATAPARKLTREAAKALDEKKISSPEPEPATAGIHMSEAALVPAPFTARFEDRPHRSPLVEGATFVEAEDSRLPEDYRNKLVVAKAARRVRTHRRMIGYLRYSSSAQSINSLIRQEELIREYAMLNGMELICVLKDRATKGTIYHRPSLDVALGMIARGEADGLLAEDCDRFARKHSIMTLLYEELEAFGAELWTMTKGHVANGTQAALYGAIAADDRDRTVERFIAGMRLAIRQGRVRNLPFGYVKIDDVYEIEEEGAEVIRLIFRLAAIGATPNDIARYLNAKNIRSPEGCDWYGRSVYSHLENPIYGGVFLWGRKRSGRPASKLPTIEIDVPSLAIVEPDVWNAVLTRVVARKPRREGEKPTKLRARTLSEFLYGAVTCEVCGRSMQRQWHGKNGSKPQLQFYCMGVGDEVTHTIQAHVVQDAVLDCVAKHILTPEGEAAFQQDYELKRKRDKRAVARERKVAERKFKLADAEADETRRDSWMRGANEDRRARLREELEAKVDRLRDNLNALILRDKRFEDEDVSRGSLKHRLDRLRLDEPVQDGTEEGFALLDALQDIFVGATVRLDREASLCDVTIRLAPFGDARAIRGVEAARAAGEDVPDLAHAVATESRRIYFRPGRTLGDPYMARLHRAMEGGRWLLTPQDYDRITRLTPALARLPSSWSREEHMEFVRALIIADAANFGVADLEKIIGRSPKNGGLIYAYLRFSQAGGGDQLREALKRLTLAMVPKPSFEPFSRRGKSRVLRWLPEWDVD